MAHVILEASTPALVSFRPGRPASLPSRYAAPPSINFDRERFKITLINNQQALPRPYLLPAQAEQKLQPKRKNNNNCERRTTYYETKAAKMAPTIEELDATVRAFYEGRGETVSTSRKRS